MTTKRVALYLRVSTDSQTTENQHRELAAVAERMGWEVVGVYEDAGISGAKGRDKRPQFDALCKAATRRQVDMIMAWSVDRLGRSLQDLVGFMNELRAVGCDLYLHKQALDTSTPAGRMMFQMCGVFAEFEREMIRDRVNSGLARAKANGTKLGRPKAGAETVELIKLCLGQGQGMNSIARELGAGVSLVQRVKKEMQGAAAA